MPIILNTLAPAAVPSGTLSYRTLVLSVQSGTISYKAWRHTAVHAGITPDVVQDYPECRRGRMQA